MANYPFIGRNGTLDFQDLANKACILRPSLTGILTRLEKAGMAVRLKPSNDQRRVFLKLTQEGEKLYQSIGEKVDERYDAIENVFSKEKLEKLKRTTNRISNDRKITEIKNKTIPNDTPLHTPFKQSFSRCDGILVPQAFMSSPQMGLLDATALP